MTTTIDNTQRVFILRGTGWNTQQYACNLKDVTNCAKQFEDMQPYTISEIWNGSLHKMSIKKVAEMLEANQMDSSLFKKKKAQQPRLTPSIQ